jgi:phosphatidylglycerol lysyltransferase
MSPVSTPLVDAPPEPVQPATHTPRLALAAATGHHRQPAERPVARALTRAIRRLPFSVLLAGTLVVVAALTGTLTGGALALATRERFGYDLDALAHGHLWVLVTSEVFTESRAHLLTTLAMIVAWVVPLEWLAGTRTTVVAYAAGTLIGTFVAALMSLGLHHLGDWSPTPDLITHADVGASVGCWATAAALVVTLVGRGRSWRLIGVGLAVYSVAYLAHALVAKGGVADVAHPIGFIAGVLVALLAVSPRLGARRSRLTRPEQPA